MTDKPPHIEISGLRFSYSNQADPILDIHSLRVHAGERLALIGTSGAGKTSLLKLIDGRLRYWSGQVSVLGESLSAKRKLRGSLQADIGVVFQEFALIDRLSVYENVRIGRLGRTHPMLSLVGHFSNADDEAIVQAIEDVGLADWMHQRVDQLSGGQRQRVSVARCLAQEPRILIADEPVSSLDPATAERVLELLTTTAGSRGMTLIISSHQPTLVAGFVDRIIGLKLGKISFDSDSSTLQTNDLAAFYDDTKPQSDIG